MRPRRLRAPARAQQRAQQAPAPTRAAFSTGELQDHVEVVRMCPDGSELEVASRVIGMAMRVDDDHGQRGELADADSQVGRPGAGVDQQSLSVARDEIDVVAAVVVDAPHARGDRLHLEPGGFRQPFPGLPPEERTAGENDTHEANAEPSESRLHGAPEYHARRP